MESDKVMPEDDIDRAIRKMWVKGTGNWNEYKRKSYEYDQMKKRNPSFLPTIRVKAQEIVNALDEQARQAGFGDIYLEPNSDPFKRNIRVRFTKK
jgi:hypothetical protein